MKLLEAYGRALLKYDKYDSDKDHSRFDYNIFVEEFKIIGKRARDFGVSDVFINELWNENKGSEQFFRFYVEDNVLKASAFYKVAYIYPRKYTNYSKYRYINGAYRSFYQYLLFTDAGKKREVILEQMIKAKDISKEALSHSDDISREMYVEASY